MSKHTSPSCNKAENNFLPFSSEAPTLGNNMYELNKETVSEVKQNDK